ncbi:MAG: hypothetical protein V1911_02120 [Candidatus Micrarchaeota archaeon]
MILENPALVLNIGMKDIMEILESTLKEKNWRNFDMANMKLVYVPYYIFNYDTLVEQKMQDQTFSQGFSGTMAMHAVSGKLEPLLIEVMEKQPVNYEREVSHDLKFEAQKAAINMAEVKDTAKIKLAGQFNVGKDSMATSGFRLVYWPVWVVFVTLPNKKIQKMEVEAVSGYPMNIEEVPERELTWVEVTQDTIEKMKTAQGWAELSKTAASAVGGAAKAAAAKSKSAGGGGEEGGEGGGPRLSFLKNKSVIWIILAIIAVIAIYLFL